MKKKLLASVMVLALAGACLAGCGKKKLRLRLLLRL